MRLGFILLLLTTVSCAAPSLNQATVLMALNGLPGGKTPRLYLGPNETPRWLVPVDLTELPTAVRRTAKTVLQGGDLHFAGTVYGGSEPAYLVEKVYPELGKAHKRRVLIAEDGSVLLRSHSLSLTTAPLPVVARIMAAGNLESLEFVEGNDQSYFRATILEAGGVRRVKTYTAEGELLRETRVLSVETTVSR